MGREELSTEQKLWAQPEKEKRATTLIRSRGAQGASIPRGFSSKPTILQDKKPREEEETRKQGRKEISR